MTVLLHFLATVDDRLFHRDRNPARPSEGVTRCGRTTQQVISTLATDSWGRCPACWGTNTKEG